MIRKTITIDDELYDLIQKLRAKMLSGGKDMSFAGTVNVVLVSGIVGSEKFDEQIWKEIAEFMEEDKIEAGIEKTIDQYTSFLIKRLKKLREIHNL